MQKVAGTFPEQVTDAGYLGNPMGTNPYPYPSGMPSAFWSNEPTMLKFSTLAGPLIYGYTTWKSPVFDLRPEYRGSMTRSAGTGYLTAQAPSLGLNRQPVAASTTVNATGTVPIWRPMGGAGKLWVQVFNLTSFNWVTSYGFQVFTREYANVNDPNDLQQISSDEDITTEFVGKIPSALVQCLPPGSGYPVRYYQLELIFQYTQDVTAEADWLNLGLRLAASYY
jgi:hypothetical protein